jgi:hypothetical protein
MKYNNSINRTENGCAAHRIPRWETQLRSAAGYASRYLEIVCLAMCKDRD